MLPHVEQPTDAGTAQLVTLQVVIDALMLCRKLKAALSTFLILTFFLTIIY